MRALDISLVEATLSVGAYKAEIIEQNTIVLSESFRDICKSNSCGNYGRNWMCPPHQGDIQELMNKIRSFPHGMLYQSVETIEDSFDYEGMMIAAKEHAKLCQRIDSLCRTLLKKEHFHLSAGGCKVCDRCAILDNLPCRLPEKAIGPMEGAGIDVYNTSLRTNLEYINGANTVTYFGLVLFFS